MTIKEFLELVKKYINDHEMGFITDEDFVDLIKEAYTCILSTEG